MTQLVGKTVYSRCPQSMNLIDHESRRLSMTYESKHSVSLPRTPLPLDRGPVRYLSTGCLAMALSGQTVLGLSAANKITVCEGRPSNLYTTSIRYGCHNRTHMAVRQESKH